jgi:hypothetical protein
VIGGEAIDVIADVPPAGIIIERVVSEASRMLVAVAATTAPAKWSACSQSTVHSCSFRG